MQQQCEDIYEDILVSATRAHYPHAFKVRQLLAARGCVPLLSCARDREQLGAWVGACERGLGGDPVLLRKVAAGETLSAEERVRVASVTGIF
jgi:hypothetical protein